MATIRLRQQYMPASMAGWTLTGSFGLPRYWPTIWANVLKADLEESTRGRHLIGVEKFYRSVIDQTGGDRLDAMITNLDFDALEAALGGHLTVLRNSGANERVSREADWSSARMFLNDVLTHLGPKAERSFAEARSRVDRLARLYGQIAPSLPRPPAPIRALPAVVVEDLYRLFDPESPDNPFRTSTLRWRNFLLFLMLLHLGLRRGEAALLATKDIKDDIDPQTGQLRYWLSVDKDPDRVDPRLDQPGLKTKQSRRQLPLSNEIVKVSDIFIDNYCRGQRHGYLFGSQKRKPLTKRQISRVIETAIPHLSDLAIKALSDRRNNSITPHDLRHTCAVYRLSRYLNQNDNLDLAVDKLRVFFGWSETSQMPRHYARAYFESQLADVWNDNYDTFVDTLRSLQGIQN